MPRARKELAFALVRIDVGLVRRLVAGRPRRRGRAGHGHLRLPGLGRLRTGASGQRARLFRGRGHHGRRNPGRRHAERSGRHGARRHRLLPAHGRRILRASAGARTRRASSSARSTSPPAATAGRRSRHRCVRPQGQDHRGRAEPAGAPAAAGGAAPAVQSVDPRYQSLGHRRGRCGRRVRQPRCGRGRHLRAGAQSGGRHPPGPRRPHRRVVEGLCRPDPRHHHGAHRRAGGQSRQIRQVPARHLPGDRLLRAPGRSDPDHRQPLLAHAGGFQGHAAQLPLHALRGGARSWAPRTSRAAFSRCSARPWRSIWNSAPPTWSCSRRTTSPRHHRACRRTGSSGRAAA